MATISFIHDAAARRRQRAVEETSPGHTLFVCMQMDATSEAFYCLGFALISGAGLVALTCLLLV